MQVFPLAVLKYIAIYFIVVFFALLMLEYCVMC